MSQQVKNLPAKAGNVGSIPRSGRSPGEGNDNPLQYSCLGNPMDRGAWKAAVHKVAQSQARLNTHAQFNKSKLDKILKSLSHAIKVNYTKKSGCFIFHITTSGDVFPHRLILVYIGSKYSNGATFLRM